MKHPYRSITSTRDVKRVARRHMGHPLRLLQPGDDVNHLAIVQVDDADAAVAQFCNEKAMPLRIECQVIDPPCHIPERNLGFQFERQLLRLCGLWRYHE